MTPNEQIQSELQRIEQEQNVRILYACESGSRAWGFESQDSDFDVRFIYIQPTQRYLRVMPGRDVIEKPVNDVLDISGWDLRKALRLLHNSNPPLLEWLQSPIVYLERPDVVSWIRELMPQYYQPAACHYHYLHMAQGNNREYLQGDVVWLKKYLYVLRPVLACLWIERGYGIVPMKFASLAARVLDEGELKTAVEDLVRRKRQGDELSRGPRIPIISDFLERELARLADKPAPAPTRSSTDDLDQVFRRCLSEIYGDRIEPDRPASG
jgi:predicted nucleotidyltransferase